MSLNFSNVLNLIIRCCIHGSIYEVLPYRMIRFSQEIKQAGHMACCIMTGLFSG
jgi:hypothetical protein